jgi:endonuclease-3
MNLEEKALRIVEILDKLYPKPDIPLVHEDAFTLLISVLLSAQTTDKKVNQVTPALFAKAKTPEDMAKLSVEEILSFIKSVNLAPTKARNIKALSEMLIKKHNGKVPQSFEELEEFPGVGHKTASVVMSQAFGHNAFPIDTHIHRLAHRWGLSNGSNVVNTEADLKRIFDSSLWNRLHLQIIYFGREHCPALRHDQSKCLICSWAAVKTEPVAAPKKKATPKRKTATKAKTKPKTTQKKQTKKPARKR